MHQTSHTWRLVAKRLIQLKDDDLALRKTLIDNGELGEDYHPAMEALHNRNADYLDEIIATIGYPTIEKVGQEANDAAWLIIQHAIARPDFMRKCLGLLEEAVARKQADPKHLAYLSDRIAVYEGRAQRYGTHFDWDENGKMSPRPFDDLAKVNQRRRSLGLNTLQEQTAIMRQQAKKENQIPPKDLEIRRRKFLAWKRSVGWIP